MTNQTPLPATLRPYRDHSLQSHVLVIAKATWRLSTGRLAPAEQQAGLHMQAVSVCLGDLDLDPVQTKILESRLADQVVWLDHDLAPPKPAFDVIVAGYATAPAGHARLSIDAGIRIGNHKAGMRAFAPRYWHRLWLGYEARPVGPMVARVPLSYALADWDSGFAGGEPAEQGDRPVYLPWIEALDAASRPRRHARVPAGLGFWPENAAHRSMYSGTYDDAWQQERAPDLPADFDPRFYNCAHKDLQLPAPPIPGTPIRLVHLGQQPAIDCAFPSLSLAVQARTAAGHTHPALPMTPDTLVIEPEHDRLSVVWRVLIPAGAQADSVRTVRLFKTDNPAA
ncbi:DUF2169 domain-containing protein [Pseudoduganella sp. SL102]|uniref:DUF2169 family type VI secretion system accessory protein n=1 Tax=Pseudoduganella sp. SL102 TaxID=2995154 RepID=UPI00248CD358|nr:DUF2169 domain-containing protein [Pseudoduganella sp. SL102]WBS02110.1 DUF2169 domain-containing protein [Pseudoduganella sp. SL102]